MRRAGGDLREGDRLERRLHEWQRVGLRAGCVRARAREHLLGAAAGGNQSDADFDQPHVGFGGGLHAIAVQDEFAPAAERQARRRDDDRHVGVAQRQRRLSGTCAPSGRFRPSCPPAPRAAPASGSRRPRNSWRRCRSTSAAKFAAASFRPACSICDRVAADRVHLRMELDREHAVAKIDEAGAGVALHDLLPVLRRLAESADRGRPAAPGRRGNGRARLRAARPRAAAPLPARRASSTSWMPMASHSSNGPSSQPNPHRIARSTSSIEWAMVGRHLRRVDAASGRACGGGTRRPCPVREKAS